MLIEPCIYCKSESKIYLNSSNNSIEKKINFTSTEILIEENEIKPNLFYCANCEIIFSEFCKNKFEENYRDVIDPQYINQIENILKIQMMFWKLVLIMVHLDQKLKKKLKVIRV